MTIIHASGFGIVPGEEISLLIPRLISHLRDLTGDKTVVFENGTYFINSETCEKHMLHITNTVGDGEFSREETPHLAQTAFFFSGITRLTVDGGDSVFIINGKAIPNR